MKLSWDPWNFCGQNEVLGCVCCTQHGDSVKGYLCCLYAAIKTILLRNFSPIKWNCIQYILFVSNPDDRKQSWDCQISTIVSSKSCFPSFPPAPHLQLLFSFILCQLGWWDCWHSLQPRKAWLIPVSWPTKVWTLTLFSRWIPLTQASVIWSNSLQMASGCPLPSLAGRWLLWSPSSVFDQELLAAYSKVRHFQPSLERHHCTLHTDHCPLAQSFHRSKDPWSQWQQQHLLASAEFFVDVNYQPGHLNVVADAVSAVTLGVDYHELDTQQQTSQDVWAYWTTVTGH